VVRPQLKTKVQGGWQTGGYRFDAVERVRQGQPARSVNLAKDARTFTRIVSARFQMLPRLPSRRGDSTRGEARLRFQYKFMTPRFDAQRPRRPQFGWHKSVYTLNEGARPRGKMACR
jgi:hypothetical protein